MNPIKFSKGKLIAGSYEFVILNGTLRDRYTGVELNSLNESSRIPNIALIPHHQQTVLEGEFSPSPKGLEGVIKGNAKLICLRDDGVSVTYDLQLFGNFNNAILASEISEESSS